jgi:septum formation protein
VNFDDRPRLVLASTSPYRRELLGRLRVPFDVESPAVDETPLPAESPTATAARLACAKARAVLHRRPGCVVIGSDQVADLDGVRLDKPGTIDNARRQLLAASGRRASFHTAVCVMDAAHCKLDVVTTHVRFRDLEASVIERYLANESVLDCAGSAKSEGLGIALLESVEGPDPTALVGLPLIALVSLLASLGWSIP